MDAEEFSAGQRARQWFHGLTIPPGLWTVLRVDGRGFSRLTERHYAKPFDDRMHQHMTAAAEALILELGAVYGCTHSDEISVLLPPSSDLFGRGQEKLVSVSAGIASAAFTAAAGTQGHFDSRAWIGGTVPDVADYFSWRQSDAARSALGSWCYWTLRQAGSSGPQATATLTGVSTSGLNELLYQHGINYNDVPAWQRRGTGLYWQDHLKTGHDPRTGAEPVVTRRRLHIDDQLPVKDQYRALITDLATAAPPPPTNVEMA
jgi:tRNA(His) guanylyltransferase